MRCLWSLMAAAVLTCVQQLSFNFFVHGLADAPPPFRPPLLMTDLQPSHSHSSVYARYWCLAALMCTLQQCMIPVAHTFTLQTACGSQLQFSNLFWNASAQVKVNWVNLVDFAAKLFDMATPLKQSLTLIGLSLHISDIGRS